jgi:hypothetical protein
VAARVDLQPKVQWQCARVVDPGLDLFQMAARVEDGKPEGFRVLFISQPEAL